ncbi:MAG: SPOR domain-containing protein [Bacteroidia bacterium]
MKTCLLLLFVSLFCFDGLLAQPQIKMIIGENLQNGEIHEAKLYVIKGETEGNLLITQKYPSGFIVNEQNSAGALFSFSEQELRLQWLNLPDRDTIFLEYAIFIPDNLSGPKKISSQLTYMEDEVRKTQVTKDIDIEVLEPINASEKGSQSIQEIKESPEIEKPLNSKVEFKIQLGAFSNEIPKEQLAIQFGIPANDIIYFKHKGLHKYAFGRFKTKYEAQQYMKKNAAMTDKTFVVAFLNNKRIEMDEVIENTIESEE